MPFRCLTKPSRYTSVTWRVPAIRVLLNTESSVRANRDHVAQKLHAEKQRNDVLHAVEGEGKFDFVLLDTRGRQALANGHIPGALCAPLEELEQLTPLLSKDKEVVAYLLESRLTSLRESGSASWQSKDFWLKS